MKQYEIYWRATRYPFNESYQNGDGKQNIVVIDMDSQGSSSLVM